MRRQSARHFMLVLLRQTRIAPSARHSQRSELFAHVQVLLLNKTRLPPEALFLIRHQRFHALNRTGEPYHKLLSEGDRLMVPWLARFKELSAYKRKPPPPGGRLSGDAFRSYYSGLIAKYIPQGTLRW